MAETKRAAITLVKDVTSIRALCTNSNYMSQLANVASKYLTPEKMLKIASLAAYRQPELYKCTMESFCNAIIEAGEYGLDFGGISGEGYMIAYGNKNLPRGVKECKFMPGYQGFIKLAYRTGQIEFIDSQLVYEQDSCDYQLGSDPSISHRPKLQGERGDMIFGYGLVILKDSARPKIEFMTAAELMLIKARSRSGDSGPWKTDLSEMCRKTLIRRIWKYIPKTPIMTAAIETDNQDFDSFDVAADKASADVNETMGSEPVDSPPSKGSSRKKVESTTTNAKTKGYHCTNCNVMIGNKPGKEKDGKLQCPECLKWTVVAADPENFLEDD